MGKRYYDWNKNFTFSNPEKDSFENKVKYDSNKLTTDEALKYLGISRKTLKNFIDKGDLKPVRITSKYNEKKFSYYFDLEEISIIRLSMLLGK